MKNKLRFALIALILFVLVLGGCGSDKPNSDEEQKGNPSAYDEGAGGGLLNGETNNGNTLEIKEKMFITQINDIYYNFEDYKDKTIIVEGMYGMLYSQDGTPFEPVVYRNGPGCCGNDGWGGFLLDYDDEFPNENDWVRVSGKPELRETEEGYVYLYLKVSSLEVKTERGAEYVAQ